jgi:hypothetical protein
MIKVCTFCRHTLKLSNKSIYFFLDENVSPKFVCDICMGSSKYKPLSKPSFKVYLKGFLLKNNNYSRL